MNELSVVQAFVNGRHGEMKGLKSDGSRLFTGGDVFAEWQGDRVAFAAQYLTGSGTVSRDTLKMLVSLEIRKNRLLKCMKAANMGHKPRRGHWSDYPARNQMFPGDDC